ncbi:hypothetical protein I553_4272 [Mycobacterium xenopi 4042]|uniref:Uncharacterized protein n=1 Tax=Mycobacterium xenopi 4042 TaxID=1299334 RepID=X8ADJ8_MYCXE|nr:hypothetical protein I553_4272 [Mycobacterium xenopi 4042]
MEDVHGGELVGAQPGRLAHRDIHHSLGTRHDRTPIGARPRSNVA